jgi:hypothetical protein
MLLAQPNKHAEAALFAAGLEACGFTVHARIDDPKPGDVLVVWNRMGAHHTHAKRFEQARATVLVAENGYLGAQWQGRRWFALSRSHHNGRGRWPQGGPERWASWGVELAPMRGLMGETVLLAQRGIGEPDLRAPDHWTAETARSMRARIRRHPGTSTTGPSLAEDLANAAAVVTWSSGAALQAMLMGCWCFYGMPGWIGAPAATLVGRGLSPVDLRLPMFERMAWAMWDIDEVARGDAFREVLAC